MLRFRVLSLEKGGLNRNCGMYMYNAKYRYNRTKMLIDCKFNHKF